MLSRIKFKIEPLVNEMLDQLPAKVWTSKTTTFLDPSIGGGQFVSEIERRLLAHGHSKENVAGRVFGCEELPHRLDYAISKHKLIGQYSVAMFLEQDFNMRFNVIVGNPPFQEGDRLDSANKLWPHFVKKANDLVADNGYVAMITPTGWMQPTADIGKGRGKNATNIFNDIFKTNNLIQANIDSNNLQRNHFAGVGSTFSYFIFQKAPYTGTTEFITETGPLQVNISNIDSLPKVTTSQSLSIVRKMKGAPFNFVDQNHGLNGEEVLTQDKGHPHKLYHTNADGGTYRYGAKSIHAASPKVIITTSGRYLPLYNNTDGFSNMCMAVVCKSVKEAKNTATVLNSNLYRFWVEMQKFSGFVPRNLVLTLPAVDTSKAWTDTELYKHFKLTKAEIAYIEDTVK